MRVQKAAYHRNTLLVRLSGAIRQAALRQQARPTELLRAKAASGGMRSASGLDEAIHSDINPEAGANLRSRSVVDNAREALRKQEEMKSRSKAQKRDDLCEMLGRGC